MSLKRTALLRRTPLRARSRPRQRPASPSVARTPDPAREAWKTPRYGRCQACGLIDVIPLHGHHVLERQTLARMGLPEYAPENRMCVCERCHSRHHNGQANRKIPVGRIPEAALAYLVDVLGEDGAVDYLRRRYAV